MRPRHCESCAPRAARRRRNASPGNPLTRLFPMLRWGCSRGVARAARPLPWSLPASSWALRLRLGSPSHVARPRRQHHRHPPRSSPRLLPRSPHLRHPHRLQCRQWRSQNPRLLFPPPRWRRQAPSLRPSMEQRGTRCDPAPRRRSNLLLRQGQPRLLRHRQFQSPHRRLHRGSSSLSPSSDLDVRLPFSPQREPRAQRSRKQKGFGSKIRRPLLPIRLCALCASVVKNSAVRGGVWADGLVRKRWHVRCGCGHSWQYTEFRRHREGH